jgi:four helix bundle protein
MARNKAELGYRGLEVWQVAIDLAVEVYQLVKLIPADERFSLSDQLRRAVVSIPANIAEGYGRGLGDYRRFVQIARGSLMELETEIELTVRTGMIKKPQIVLAWKLCQSTGKMLTKLYQSLKDR